MLYNGEGELISPPIPDVHFRALRTKLQKGSIPRLLDIGQDANKKDDDVALKKQSDNNKPAAKNTSPRGGTLMDYVKHLVQEARGNFSQRDGRVFSCLFAKGVDAATNDILHSAFEKYLEKQDTIITKQSTSDLVPDPTLSTGEEQGVVVTPVSRFAESSRTIIITDDNGGKWLNLRMSSRRIQLPQQPTIFGVN